MCSERRRGRSLENWNVESGCHALWFKYLFCVDFICEEVILVFVFGMKLYRKDL